MLAKQLMQKETCFINDLQQKLLQHSFIEELAERFNESFSHRLKEFQNFNDSFLSDWFVEWIDGVLAFSYADYIVEYMENNYDSLDDDMDAHIDNIVDEQGVLQYEETCDDERYQELLEPVVEALRKKLKL